MRRQLTSQERLLLALGALVIVLLLGYAVISGQVGEQTSGARRRLATAKADYKSAVDLVEDYDRKGRLIEERKERIARKPSNFDLPTFITDIEKTIGTRFQPASVGRPTVVPMAAGKYTLTRVKYTYKDKTIGDIVRYLYDIENPENGIIISNVLIQTVNEAEGDKFQMVITLSVVTQISAE